MQRQMTLHLSQLLHRFASKVLSVRLYTFTPPFVPFTKTVIRSLTVHIIFTSFSAIDLAMHALFCPLRHLLQGLPLPLLPSISDSYTLLVNHCPLIRLTCQNRPKTLTSALSLINSPTLTMCCFPHSTIYRTTYLTGFKLRDYETLHKKKTIKYEKDIYVKSITVMKVVLLVWLTTLAAVLQINTCKSNCFYFCVNTYVLKYITRTTFVKKYINIEQWYFMKLAFAIWTPNLVLTYIFREPAIGRNTFHDQTHKIEFKTMLHTT